VSGAGETFVAGARVMKNVTGYDLSKLMAGSWGRLAVLTQVSLRTMPRCESDATLMFEGLGEREAITLMSRAMAAPLEVAAAAHRPASQGTFTALTGLRFEGFGPSVAARMALARTVLAEFESIDATPDEATAFWIDIRSLRSLPREAPLWRVSVPVSRSAQLIAACDADPGSWLMDWAGGLVWLALPLPPQRIRDAAAIAGGHAMLVRAPEELRASTPMLHPQAPAVAVLERRVRAAFDPEGIFETGRFLDVRHAD
jgi:glycolate oxidase FAD binding subunit